MNHDPASEDRLLVERCLSGSRSAWEEFYCRFLPLVRKAVQKSFGFCRAEFDDIVQNVFLSLYTDLKGHDPHYPVSRFVWVVAKRVCIDEYRMSKSAKRSGSTVSVDHHDGLGGESIMVQSPWDSPEDQMGRMQLLELVRAAFSNLSKKCGEILRLRYFEELSFGEMADQLGADKKTLAVQAGRCLDELRAWYAELERKGWRS